VLLTAYADTEVAIRAINTARIHYYLTKPWIAEEKLYPVLGDLLKTGRRLPASLWRSARELGTAGPQDHRCVLFSPESMPYKCCRCRNEESLKLLTDAGLDPSHFRWWCLPMERPGGSGARGIGEAVG